MVLCAVWLGSALHGERVLLADSKLDEIKNGWNQYAEELKLSKVQMNGVKSEIRSNTTFLADGQKRASVREQFVDGEWEGTVLAINDRYAFELKRQNRDRPWVVAFVGSIDSDISRVRHLLGVNEVSLKYFPLSVYGVDICEMVEHPTFRVVGLTETSAAGIWEMRFTIDPKASFTEGMLMRFERGVIRLDASRHWLPVELTLHSPSGEVIRIEQSSFAATGEVETPKRTKVFVIAPTGEMPIADFEIQELLLDTPIAPREFTLSAFGLPEPLDPHDKSLLYLWIIAGGVVLALLGITLRSYHRRRS